MEESIYRKEEKKSTQENISSSYSVSLEFQNIYTTSYFPVPPPFFRYNSCYHVWKDCSCTPYELPFWEHDSSRTVSWAATAYNLCMQPVYFCDRVTYQVCCCADAYNCDCNSLEYPIPPCLCLIAMPKLVCATTGLVSACIAGIAGGLYNLFARTGHCRERMEDSSFELDEKLPLLNAASSPHNFRIQFGKRAKIIEQIDDCLKRDDLKPIMQFLSNKDCFHLLHVDPEINQRKVLIVCLAIRYTGEDIGLLKRKKFIISLLDKTIINGYYSLYGWIPAPLLEATRSQYHYSNELLEVLCYNGATFIPTHPIEATWYPFNVQLACYMDYLETQDEDLFYKALILKSYERNSVDLTFQQELKSSPALMALDKQLEDLSEKGIDRNVKRAMVYDTLKETNIPANVALIIAKYSGLFSPLDSSKDKKHLQKPIVKIGDGVKPEVKATSRKLRFLSRHEPLPKPERLPPHQERQRHPNDVSFVT